MGGCVLRTRSAADRYMNKDKCRRFRHVLTAALQQPRSRIEAKRAAHRLEAVPARPEIDRELDTRGDRHRRGPVRCRESEIENECVPFGRYRYTLPLIG